MTPLLVLLEKRLALDPLPFVFIKCIFGCDMFLRDRHYILSSNSVIYNLVVWLDCELANIGLHHLYICRLGNRLITNDLPFDPRINVFSRRDR